jgi:hypothetical protein
LSPLRSYGSRDILEGGWSSQAEADLKGFIIVSRGCRQCNNSYQAENLNLNLTAKTRVSLLFLMGLMKGEILLMMMMTSENQSSWSQFHATAILGTDETLLSTQFK